ncbi:MAG: hypothetical protein IPH95_00075 [Candidatus Promineofilum sp.]|nr:hypothetical protein [Promineifilum sp.]
MDFGALAEHYTASDVDRAFAWFALAAATTNPPDAVITRLGKVRQTNWQRDPICDWFVQQNLRQPLCQSETDDDFFGWQSVETAATYTSMPCRDSSTHRCTEIVVTEPEIQPAAGIGQCLQVTPG